MPYVATTNGNRIQMRPPANGRKYTLDELREAIGQPGCTIEPVYPRANPDIVFFCDEDGHAKGLPFNYQGTRLYNGIAGMINAHPVVGDIAVFTREEYAFWFATQEAA